MESLSRPIPPNTLVDRARAWVEWFGFTRLVVSAVAVVVVCAGAFWLVRTPPPPTEASLPRAVPSAAPTTIVKVAAEPERITVHVAGAVANPGVYTLPADSRVLASIESAGGVLGEADPNSLNLAAPLVDGARVYVPLLGEDVPASFAAESPDAGLEGGVVDVNRASAEGLEELPGVGPATAKAIITERDRNGPFLSIGDLERVPGIGPAKLDAMREFVTT